MDNTKDIAIVHLIWLPFGIEYLIRFLNSYHQNKPRFPHDTVLLFNGVTHESETTEYHQYIRNNFPNFIYSSYYMKTGQDIDAYLYAANQLKNAYLIFFNSYTIFNAKNWLEIYVNNFNGYKGIISATASYESHYSSVFKNHPHQIELGKGFSYNYRKYKLFIKAALYWRLLFKPFPNAHIRTNAFMIKRELFLQLRIKSPLKNKFEAYKVESGKNSITNQILQMGYEVGIVGRDGKYYELKECNKSNIFFQGNQENLLISDNQTERFTNASELQKKHLTYLAWGTK